MGTDHSTREAADRQTVAAAVAFPSALSHRSRKGPWSRAEAWPSLLRRHTGHTPEHEGAGMRHVTGAEAAPNAGQDRRMAGGRVAAAAAVVVAVAAAAAGSGPGRKDGADSWGRGRGHAGCSRPCFGWGRTRGCERAWLVRELRLSRTSRRISCARRDCCGP